MSFDQPTVRRIPCHLCSPGHPELSILTREGNAKGERGVGDVLIEVVLLTNCSPPHVLHVHFHRQSGHAHLLVHHLLPHLLNNHQIRFTEEPTLRSLVSLCRGSS